MTEWQPIETAPKDGTRILAYWPDTFGAANATQIETWFGPTRGRFSEPCWQSVHEWGGCDNDPTYWMPLPEPPVRK